MDASTYESLTPSRSSSSPSRLYGIYLPFCAHILRQLVNRETYKMLSENYTIEFETKEGRGVGETTVKPPHNHYDYDDSQKLNFGNSLLHLGTQEVRPHIMQNVFQKDLNQEELYCGMRNGIVELKNSGDQTADVNTVISVYR